MTLAVATNLSIDARERSPRLSQSAVSCREPFKARELNRSVDSRDGCPGAGKMSAQKLDLIKFCFLIYWAVRSSLDNQIYPKKEHS